MLRTALLSTVALTVLAAPAVAGGTAPTPQPPAIVPVEPSVDWGGFYGGVTLEYGEGESSAGPTDLEVTNYGFFAGYRVDYGNWVLGTEFDWVSSDISSPTINDGADAIIRSTLEIGVEAGNALIYGTGGVFMLDLNAAGAGGIDDTDWGYVVGAGIDYQINDRLFIGGEVLYHRINDFSGSGADIDATTVGLGLGFRF